MLEKAIAIGDGVTAYANFGNMTAADDTTLVNRGIVSHCKGQAAGLARFVTGAHHVISMNQLDDASMWVKDPTR